jgi:mRNA-degrading endonuclease RelE of RelBE toxin-antitoxin system
MDKVTKALKKLTPKERKTIDTILEKIVNKSFESLDIKALKGYKNIYRVRKESIRIIFEIDKEKVIILAVERRSEKTYKF